MTYIRTCFNHGCRGGYRVDTDGRGNLVEIRTPCVCQTEVAKPARRRKATSPEPRVCAWPGCEVAVSIFALRCPPHAKAQHRQNVRDRRGPAILPTCACGVQLAHYHAKRCAECAREKNRIDSLARFYRTRYANRGDGK